MSPNFSEYVPIPIRSISLTRIVPTSFIQSHQFTFFVGSEGKAIVVHSAAIAATSPQLNVLINGGMKESESGCARIENVRVEDFVRFVEFAYRGDYEVPAWEEDVEEQVVLEEVERTSFVLEKVAPPELEEAVLEESVLEESVVDEGIPEPSSAWGDWGGGVTRAVTKKGKKKKSTWMLPVMSSLPAPEPESFAEEIGFAQEGQIYNDSEPVVTSQPRPVVMTLSRTTLRTNFNSRIYLNDAGPKARIQRTFDPKPNTAANQNFTAIFLAHARLYSFAHVRLVSSLKELTLSKLHKTLMDFKLYTKRVGDIIELARYAYSDPDLPGRSENGTLDELRKLVVEYVVCEIDTIGKCEEFVRYMEEGGEFVGDFWRMAREYMN